MQPNESSSLLQAEETTQVESLPQECSKMQGEAPGLDVGRGLFSEGVVLVGQLCAVLLLGFVLEHRAPSCFSSHPTIQ